MDALDRIREEVQHIRDGITALEAAVAQEVTKLRAKPSPDAVGKIADSLSDAPQTLARARGAANNLDPSALGGPITSSTIISEPVEVEYPSVDTQGQPVAGGNALLNPPPAPEPAPKAKTGDATAAAVGTPGTAKK